MNATCQAAHVLPHGGPTHVTCLSETTCLSTCFTVLRA